MAVGARRAASVERAGVRAGMRRLEEVARADERDFVVGKLGRSRFALVARRRSSLARVVSLSARGSRLGRTRVGRASSSVSGSSRASGSKSRSPPSALPMLPGGPLAPAPGPRGGRLPRSSGSLIAPPFRASRAARDKTARARTTSTRRARSCPSTEAGGRPRLDASPASTHGHVACGDGGHAIEARRRGAVPEQRIVSGMSRSPRRAPAEPSSRAAASLFRAGAGTRRASRRASRRARRRRACRRRRQRRDVGRLAVPSTFVPRASAKSSRATAWRCAGRERSRHGAPTTRLGGSVATP